MFRKITILAYFLAFIGGLSAQTIFIGDTINHYVKVTDFSCEDNEVTVVSPAGFAVGDTVLLIQMKGAGINTTNTASYGNVTDTLSAGNYELCRIATITGNVIAFQFQVIRNYDPAGAVQLVRVPYYPNAARLSSLGGGNLSCKRWSPITETGGVLAFIVGGELSWANNRRIDVSVNGFTGGRDTVFSQACGFGAPPSNFQYTVASVDGAYKGEGISYNNPGFPCGRGKVGNGAGGGNDHNTGGGGGGNFGEGGQGGVRVRSGGFSTCRGENPGLGGLGLTYDNSSNKIFMGGGGGAGHASNTSPGGSGSAGTRGAGIVLIRAGSVRGNNRQVRAFGTRPQTAASDGAGGGGSGGTVLIETPTFTNNLTVELAGGAGGRQNWSGANNQCMGTGGGGGGGVFWHSGATVPGPGTVNVSGAGGAAGFQQGTCAADGTTGATDGNPAGTISNLVIPESFTNPNMCGVLPVLFSQIRAEQVNDEINVLWATASEINNDYFSVERSADGQNFSEIDRKPSNGGNHQFASYEIRDEDPFFGINYYRVRQVDFNGQSTVSGVQQVNFRVDHQLELSVWPNPVEGGTELHTSFVMPYDGFVSLRLVDPLGKVVYEDRQEVFEGVVRLTVPTEATSSGIYFLKINTADFSEIKRVSVFKN